MDPKDIKKHPLYEKALLAAFQGLVSNQNFHPVSTLASTATRKLIAHEAHNLAHILIETYEEK